MHSDTYIDPKTEILQQIERYADPISLTWYERAALDAHRRGCAHTIMDRTGTAPYLTRYWLSKPQHRHYSTIDADPDRCPWHSANSVLLHYMHQPDDSPDLHDHPWPFRTHVLCGGYIEQRPPIDWDGIHGPHRNHLTGIERCYGDSYQISDHMPHRISRIDPDTWTLVTTGELRKSEKWGFYPPDQERIPYDIYLDTLNQESLEP